MKNIVKIVLPVMVIIFSAVIAVIIINMRPDVETAPIEINPILINVHTVQKQSIEIIVGTQGNVTPRTETSLVAQVAGQVTTVSSDFVNGGFFEKGDVLVNIDDSDYDLAVIQANYQVAQAELRLKIEEQEGKVARQEWQLLNNGEIPALVARIPQLNEAKASLESAKAGKAQAQLNLERTRIRAPYTGRVRQKSVDVGQYINPGMSVGIVYAVDFAEIRLPLPDEELAFIDMSLNFRGKQTDFKGPRVILRAQFAGREHAWEGYISRIEGEIDTRSRMIYVVARVEDPYGRISQEDKPPLTVGMFVNAEIVGKEFENIAVIPRSIIRENSQVLVVDDQDRLWFRDISILRLETDKAYIDSGLQEGERICTTPILAVIDGMPVTVIEDDKSSGFVNNEKEKK
ncbi:efflux RND transporter periplasmic adaptor subunit [candidate division KSB1 bacterium]